MNSPLRRALVWWLNHDDEPIPETHRRALQQVGTIRDLRAEVERLKSGRTSLFPADYDAMRTERDEARAELVIRTAERDDALADLE